RSRENRPASLLLNAAAADQMAGAEADAARLYLELGSTYPSSREAQTALDALRDLGQYNALPPYFRGRILFQSGQASDAVEAFSKVIDSDASPTQQAAAGYYRALAWAD